MAADAGRAHRRETYIPTPHAGIVVLTRKVGRERSYGVVLLLYIITFSIYGYYWWFRVHDELQRQFELDREGRDQAVVWLVMGVLFYPLLFVHLGYLVSNLRYVRQRLGMRDGLTVGGFLGLAITGVVLFFMGYMSFAILFGIADVVEDAMRTPLIVSGIITWIVLAVASAVLLIIAYARLQGDLNEVWRAYDQRMAELMAPEPDSPAPSGWAAPSA